MCRLLLAYCVGRVDSREHINGFHAFWRLFSVAFKTKAKRTNGSNLFDLSGISNRVNSDECRQIAEKSNSRTDYRAVLATATGLVSSPVLRNTQHRSIVRLQLYIVTLIDDRSRPLKETDQIRYTSKSYVQPFYCFKMLWKMTHYGNHIFPSSSETYVLITNFDLLKIYSMCLAVF